MRRNTFFVLLCLLALMLSCSISQSQRFTTLHSFTGADGSFPLGQLIQGMDGKLYGTTNGGGAGYGTVFKIALDGSGFASYSLPSNLQGPWSGVSQASDGTLYGSSLFGGIGLGAVFKAQPDGTGITLLYSFSGGADGGWPHGAPLPGNDGFLYGGTQAFGDAAYGSGAYGDGVLYKLASDGSQFSVMHSFNSSDGQGSLGGLILANDGLLYGNTTNGGPANYGVVFKIGRDGTGFQGFSPFFGPDYGHVTPLIQGPDGTLYSTSVGSTDGTGAGAVYKIAPDGTGYADLATFSGYDINSPLGIADQFARVTVALGHDGNLYGSSIAGGTNGTLFRVGRDGRGFTTLYTFSPLGPSNINSDGAYPLATVIGSDGSLYGTTPYGGAYGYGTIFKLETATYQIGALYDQTRSVKQGACFPIKLQLLDSSGANVSSAAFTLHATGIARVSGLSGTLESVGNANPDYDFRYDSSLQGYIFNLNTSPLASGTWVLSFTATNDPAVHTIQLGVK